MGQVGNPTLRLQKGMAGRHLDHIPPAAAIGEIGPYRLLRRIAKGGMSEVHLAVRSGPMGFSKKAALKIIPVGDAEDDRLLQALINEARIGGQLHHRNIVEVYDFLHTHETFCLVMEYVDGWTLKAIVRACCAAGVEIPPAVIMHIGIDICAGLEHAHNQKSEQGDSIELVHRDLKPSNIIVARTGETKIMDFGVAKTRVNLYQTGGEDITRGTPLYMSPEQVTGKGELTRRSDLFPLGSILQEMVTLEETFHGDTLVEVMHQVLEADVGGAVDRVAVRFSGLAPVVEKAMAVNPAARYDSAREMGRVLRDLQRQMEPGPDVEEWLEWFERLVPSEPTASNTTPSPLIGGAEDDSLVQRSSLGEFTREFFRNREAAEPALSPRSAVVATRDGRVLRSTGETGAGQVCSTVKRMTHTIADAVSMLDLGDLQGWSVQTEVKAWNVCFDHDEVAVLIGPADENPETTLLEITGKLEDTLDL